MEEELARNLMSLGTAFAKARGLEETTVGRMCAADGRFFARLRDGKAFTAKKYDTVVDWFAANWPADAAWPAGIARPEAAA